MKKLSGRPPSMLIDPCGRTIDYLRLSVTNRCNLRCVYCLPAFGFKPSPDTLTDDEIVHLVSIFSEIGVNKIRITGGEPLMRPGITSLVNQLANLEGISDLSMSTNGILLGSLAFKLKAAGLKRVNISLDSLRPDRFEQITRRGRLSDVMNGIYAAFTAGLEPVKLNVVVMRGVNDDEINDFARLSYEMPLHVRFIELMPIGATGFFSRERLFTIDQIRERCGPLEPVDNGSSPLGSGPAEYYQAPGALGTIGFIGSLSSNFCARCNRLRLTAQGMLHPCLASEIGVDLKGPLRSGASDDEIAALIQKSVSIKPERHLMDSCLDQELVHVAVREAFMCALGG